MEAFGVTFELILFFLITSAFIIYLYLKYVVYNVWNRNGVICDKPKIPLGNVPWSYIQGKITHGDIIKESYEKYKSHPFHGVYILFEPVLVITDPNLLQLVMLKNFSNFRDRGILSSQLKDPLTAGLSRMDGEKWKRIRGKFAPTFTSGRLKQMYPLFKEICDQLIDVCEKTLENVDVIEFKELTMRYTMDCILSIFYGLNFNTLKNDKSNFIEYGKMSNYHGRMFILMAFYNPQWIYLYPMPKIRKNVQKFFVKLFDTLLTEEKNDSTFKTDFLNILIKFLTNGKVQKNENISEQSTFRKITENDKLTMTEAIGQAFLFFSAGHDAISSAITLCLYELALNPNIQEKLYQEIKKVNSTPEGLSYETLSQMQYMHMVCQETLRKYPASPVINRICREDFKIPNANLTIKKGTRVVIPITGLQSDPDIYPEPEKFDPERFAPENKVKRHNLTYQTFGAGPRQCMGNRFALMQFKILLFYLLLNYEFSPSAKTAVPIKFSTEYFILIPQNVYLKLERRDAINK